MATEKSLHIEKAMSENADIVHTPVLLAETLEHLAFDSAEKGFMVDSTLGEGGHSFAFLERFENLSIIGLDADAEIQKRAKKRLAQFGDRMQFFNGWFNDFYANYPQELPQPDRILFDLGISVFHYECSGRGFSFRSQENLDMRLDSGKFNDATCFQGKYTGQTVEDLVNNLPENELADILFYFAEERYSRRIARAVAAKRQQEPIATAKELADCIYHAVPAPYRHGAIHPATKSFQALRIAVNGELERLESVLKDAFNVLRVGGKMGVISFHSLEDRIVKKYFQHLAKHCTCPPEQPICICVGKPKATILTRKPIVAGKEEIKMNAPSRSAKLRVIQKREF
ncbi:MAG: 16S rRNA (cytosine(1402)-N(4))-methyltransferase RsmH [Spirochaetales bacterium]